MVDLPSHYSRTCFHGYKQPPIWAANLLWEAQHFRFENCIVASEKSSLQQFNMFNVVR